MPAQLFDFAAPLPRRLYWDASFLVHAAYPGGRYHQDCYRFLERLSDAEGTLSYVSTLALDEAVFALIQLRVAEDYPSQGFWNVYRENPQIVRPYLGELRTLVDRLYGDTRIQVVGTEADCMPQVLNEMESHSLLPRDALHLTAMSRCGVESIVTTDDDFLRIDGLRVYTCNPRILARA